jgi:hypothetical protein
MDLTVEQLNNGQWVARPKNQLGTCGWTPFAWTACFAGTKAKARAKFISAHEVR